MTIEGFFLRANGREGSFKRLTDAVAAGRVQGIEPVEIVAHDLLSPVESGGVLRLSLTNVLNRSVTGTLEITLGNLTLKTPAEPPALAAHETREIAIPVVSGTAREDNTYPLTVRFDAGTDGIVTHREELHVNQIARRSITVDGRLDDWKGVLSQPVKARGDGAPTLTESAWLPFAKFDGHLKSGFAKGYLSYDDKAFHFAAEILDDTTDKGAPRFANRDEDGDFYPEISRGRDGRELSWPEGVRRFSYRRRPALPFGSAPKFDNVQIAFNVIPADQKPETLPFPPGTRSGFIPVPDTDYEYALNSVAAEFGGGEEIWRCLTPGMPRKNFFPREPASPFDGPVTDGKLAVGRDGNRRIIEASIPWEEIPLVRKALDAGGTIRFSFRVNDGEGIGMELAEERSVSARNPYSFHPEWVAHWANRVEFAFGK